MPLILVTGLPCSGKSSLAKKILDYFTENLKKEGSCQQVRIVSDTENLDWDGRDVIYSSIAKEKELRGWLKSEAQRYINLKQIVILDAATYIKGFRYELFCTSKEAKTTYSVVERLIDPVVCWKWNEDRLSKSQPRESGQNDSDEPQLGYSRETFDALVLRYEKCDANNRWDSTLFKMTSQDDELDFEKLYNIITKEDPLVPNKCTLSTTTTNTIFKPVP